MRPHNMRLMDAVIGDFKEYMKKKTHFHSIIINDTRLRIKTEKC